MRTIRYGERRHWANPDPGQSTPPVFGIIGGIYSISEDFDADFGIKTGLNRPETDITVLAGIAWRR